VFNENGKAVEAVGVDAVAAVSCKDVGAEFCFVFGEGELEEDFFELRLEEGERDGHV